jgi:MFS family permease
LALHLHRPLAQSTIQIAWSFKLIIAFTCESWHPCGFRRKGYMVAGWAGVLAMMVVLALFADSLSFSSYIFCAAALELCMMVADVNADGYTVELSQREREEVRGTILANGQLCRFGMCMVGGLIQAFLLNGPTTNKPGAGFSWGLTVSQMYWLMAVVCAVSILPTLYFFEEQAPQHEHEAPTLGKQLWLSWEIMHDVSAIASPLHHHNLTLTSTGVPVLHNDLVVRLQRASRGN